MRPPKERQDRILKPLNEILGSEAKVRLLRVLALQNASLAAGELAKRAMLGRTSIYPALRQLERSGVIEFIGTGGSKLLQMRESHPLSKTLRELFQAEARRFDALTVDMRGLLSSIPQIPISAWMDDRSHNVKSPDTIDLYLVAQPEGLISLMDYLNDHLADIERKYDIHIEVHGITRSELESLQTTLSVNLDNVVLLCGVPPAALLPRTRTAAPGSAFVSHNEHDALSRRFAVAIATKIRRDPGLIAIAEDRVKSRAREVDPRERRELMEWSRILSTMSPSRLARFLLEDTERAVRLRQTLPAMSLLTPAERDAIVRSRTDAEVIAAVTQR